MRQWILLAVLVIALAAAAGHLEPQKKVPEPGGVFSQGDIAVGSGRIIEKLLVVDGNAVISGQVTHWLAVIGGTASVQLGGEIAGGIFILDGQLIIAPGAAITAPYRVILPQGSPLLKILAEALIFGLMAGLLLGALLIGTLATWLTRLKFYQQLRRLFRECPDRWSPLLILVGLAVSGFLMAVFIHLAMETVFYHEADFLDQVVIWLVRYFANPALDKTMLIITYLGSGYAYVFLAPMILAFLFWRRRRQEGIALAICLTGAAGLNFLLKHLFERARPDAFRVVSESGYSFPSGHAMVSLCFYGMIAYIVGRNLSGVGRKLVVYGLTAVLLTAVGFSRIYLGVHYPSDVLAGYIAGATWLIFCIVLLWWREEKR
ncbi:MAG: phosphatase PAP2 family protein [Negativicutes bacterium]|nr:phosphatase PAP2 family protein [Negativicutes bacterium]